MVEFYIIFLLIRSHREGSQLEGDVQLWSRSQELGRYGEGDPGYMG